MLSTHENHRPKTYRCVLVMMCSYNVYCAHHTLVPVE